MKIELNNIEEKYIKAGDFVVNDLGTLFQISNNGYFYYLIDVKTGCLERGCAASIESLLENYEIIRIIPNEKNTIKGARLI